MFDSLDLSTNEEVHYEPIPHKTQPTSAVFDSSKLNNETTPPRRLLDCNAKLDESWSHIFAFERATSGKSVCLLVWTFMSYYKAFSVPTSSLCVMLELYTTTSLEAIKSLIINKGMAIVEDRTVNISIDKRIHCLSTTNLPFELQVLIFWDAGPPTTEKYSPKLML